MCRALQLPGRGMACRCGSTVVWWLRAAPPERCAGNEPLAWACDTAGAMSLACAGWRIRAPLLHRMQPLGFVCVCDHCVCVRGVCDSLLRVTPPTDRRFERGAVQPRRSRPRARLLVASLAEATLDASRDSGFCSFAPRSASGSAALDFVLGCKTGPSHDVYT